MIITCNNCNKKFDIDSSLIPDMGRLLQCASCDHKWFFKKVVPENTVSLTDEDISNDNVNIFEQNNSPINDIESVSDTDNDELEVNLEDETKEKIEINKGENTQVNTKLKKQKNFKILNIFVVSIISFVAFIIIVDTFKYSIGKIVPNIEFILYNLYESIKDISLFIRNLI